MKRGFAIFFLVLILSTFCLSGCRPQEQPLYVMLMWHQHQPYYAPDESGVFTRPWVRVHATKDYYDMAAILKEYPKVRVTFNLTPVLIRQLDELAAGAKDNYWVLAEKPAAELTDDEKRFILRRFFDANWDNIIGRFPRYKELLDKRGGSDEAAIEAALTSFSEQDFRDLQVWFNLAWFDPDFLAQEPLKSLVDKGRDFSEADKAVIFAKAREVIEAVIPLHKELQDKGQIEVSITPYAHPILPLIYNSDLAAIGDPAAELPERFSYPPDVVAHLTRAAEVYQAHYGRQQRGLWPGEGAVAQDIVKMVAEAGFTWMASGEHVLAKSLGLDGFTRDSQEVVQEADALYRPYYVRYQDGPQVAVFFRDLRLSDLIGFEYSNWDGEQAADDLIARLQAIKARLDEEGAQGPHVVSIILDGENAWEYYPNDGKAFLHALYDRLGNTPGIQTITPSEYIKKFPQQREIENLWPGAWFSSDYGTWIGEPEEAQAWALLGKTRNMLAAYDLFKRKTAPPEALNEALDWMYLAEGSDWFWWYGADQDSGQDEYFDGVFRALQRKVYEALGEPVPDDLEVPIIPAEAVPPTRGVTGVISPTVDGRVEPADEWDAAGYYEVSGGAQARAEDVISALYYGYDAKNLYFRLDARQNWADLGSPLYAGIYLSVPRAEATIPFSRLGAVTEPKTLLGFQASHLAEVKISDGQVEASLFTADKFGNWASPQGLPAVAVTGKVLEWAVPFELLGEVEAGDIMNAVTIASLGERDVQSVPATGPVQVIIPDLGKTTVVLSVDDPANDDHGPGSYTYPTDGVFEPQVFDLQQFTVGYDEKNLVCRFKMYGPINNVWGSPINLSVQTFDVYIDADPGAGTGSRLLLEGRNAALTEGNGWDYAIWVEGWHQKVIRPDAQGRPQDMSGVGMKVIVDPAQQQVTIRVPLSVFGEGADPAKWGYAAAVLSQDGFPSPGVRRVRDILSAAEQWRCGGAPDDTNHTRIMDLAWPEGASPTQEEMLSDYPPSQEKNMDALSADDFAQVELLRP
ncbi:MAG: glycoside hydrolase [Anaerolineae bacterium]|nr:glycoside hydrolase [Anaerolineae bacterium]